MQANEKNKAKVRKINEAILVAFIPIMLEDDYWESLEIYLVNLSEFDFKYSIVQLTDNIAHYDYYGELPANSHLELDIIALTDLNYAVEISLKLDHKSENNLFSFGKNILIRPKKLFSESAFIPLIEKDGYATVFFNEGELKRKITPEDQFGPETDYEEEGDLDMKDLNVERLKEQILSRKETFSGKISFSKTENIIDLHAEKLTSDPEKMSPGEILEMQLNHVDKILDNAMVNNMHHIIFIHGIGNGVLRKAIFTKLKNNSFVKSFSNTFDGRFGFGATEVLLK